ncbi:MAG: type system specificity subunit [Proteobacteria bacterium]|nr:type system specificity subunit [Pseudomonadota bacterium]
MKAGWQTKTLDQISQNLDNKRVPITKADRQPGEYPYYGASGIVDFVADYIFDCDALLVSEDGANLLARATPIAFSASGKYWVNNHAHILKFENVTTQRFVELYLDSITLEPYITGAAQPKLNQKALNSIPVPIPLLPEQERIVAILDEAFAGIATARAAAEQNRQNARALFESHLQSVFSQRGEGWGEKSLEELGTITSSKRIFKSEYVESGVPFYRTKEIKELANGREITTELFISEARYREIKKGFGVPKAGDVLLTAIGTIGETWVVEGNDDFYFKDGNVLWLKEFTSITPRFLKYVLQSFVESLNKMSHGSAYSALPIQRLNAHKIFLPSQAEQEQIVTTLDALYDETQRLEALHQRKLEALDKLKQSLLHQAFSGAL